MTETELHENLHPDDGYRVVVVDNRPISVAVYGEIFAKGRSISTLFPNLPDAVLLYEARAEQGREFGAAQRVQHLADAVFRFLNTGGTREELAETLKTLRPLIAAPLTIPDGYYLLESYLNTDNVYEHVFVSDAQDEAVVWVENTFVDLVPWQEIVRRLGDNGKLDSAAFVERLYAGREEEDLRALPEGVDSAGDPPA